MKKLNIIVLLCLIFSLGVSAQVSVNATVECPPCRPVEGCGICWENQQQADQCEENRLNPNEEDIKSDEKLSLTVQKNPILDGNVSIVSSMQMSGQIKIYNQLGAMVKSIDLKNNQSNYLNIQLDLQSGLYFLVYYDYRINEKVTKKLLFTNK